jgi:hypothetical protein
LARGHRARPHKRVAIATYGAERLGGQEARRYDARLARCLNRMEVVAGVERRDERAWLDDV